MFEYARTWLALPCDKRGVTALEYGLIAALIGGVIVTAVTTLGTQLNAVFETISATLPAVGG